MILKILNISYLVQSFIGNDIMELLSYSYNMNKYLLLFIDVNGSRLHKSEYIVSISSFRSRTVTKSECVFIVNLSSVHWRFLLINLRCPRANAGCSGKYFLISSYVRPGHDLKHFNFIVFNHIIFPE